MFEREGVLAAIALVLERARAGQGQALFVIGEAGLGKTSVVERAREQAGGFAIGVGRGQAMEATLHFGIVSEALRGVGAGTPLDVPRAAAPAGLDARAAYFYATLRHLESRKQPALILLDDLHWADPDSLALVSFLSHRLASIPVALIATLRPWPRAALDLARHLAQQGQAQLEQLMPLTATAATALLTERMGDELPDETIERAWAASGGNPLFLEEIARHLRDGRSLADLDERGSEATILLARIAGPGADLRYAHAASVFGIEFRPLLAARVAGLDEREGTDALAVLVDTGLVRPGQPGWAQFTHPLFQQALYDDMAPPVRERWHAAAFRHLLAHGAEPSEAAEHAVNGQLLGDAEAIAVLQRAGRAAMAVGAVATARHRLQSAVTLAGESPSPQLLMGLAETLLSTGEPAKAVAMYSRILDILQDLAVDDGARAHIHRMLGRALFASGDARAAEAQFAAAAELGRSGPDPTPAIEALLDHSTACWISGRIALAADYATRARDLAQDAPPDVRRRADSTWALVMFISGSAEGLPAAAAAAAEAELNPLLETVDPTWSWGPLGNYMFMSEFAESYDEAHRVLEIAYRAAEQLGAPMAIGLLDSLRANALIRRGRLKDARAHAEHALHMVDLVPSLAGYAWVANAATVLEMGQIDEAAAWCDRLEKLPQALILRLWLQRMRGIIAGRRGQQQQASDLFLVAETIANEAGLFEPCVVPWSRDAITAHVACGRLDDAARVVAWLEARSSDLPCRWPRATAIFGRAQLAEKAGKDDEAEALYRDALQLYAQIRQPLSEIRTMIYFGRFLRQVGKAVEARPYLTRAAEVATEAGATWLAQQATEELHAAGGRHRKRSNPDALTPQEQRVAKLAIDGRKVREIAEHLSLTPRTVETHLSHIYQKLGISSHVELIKAGLPPQESG
jgi:DNA-binding CsgD family transcriptional regulator/Tfp pilus assembly protein PilF